MIFRGSDVLQYSFKSPTSFINFTPNEYQQVAKETLYRAPEKLVYKFIASRLAFAYDDEQRLTLNSANIVIPQMPGISIKVALAFLNSAIFQYVFSKKFATHKVLRGDLERLPFPRLSHRLSAELEQLVDALRSGKDVRVEIEGAVARAFGLAQSDLSMIERAMQER